MGCVGANDTLRETVFRFSYPYSSSRLSVDIPTDDPFVANRTECNDLRQFPHRTFSSSAQYFVAMGVLTMLYVIAAVIMYMFFITPKLFLAKWIVIGVRHTDDTMLTSICGLCTCTCMHMLLQLYVHMYNTWDHLWAVLVL